MADDLTVARRAAYAFAMAASLFLAGCGADADVPGPDSVITAATFPTRTPSPTPTHTPTLTPTATPSPTPTPIPPTSTPVPAAPRAPAQAAAAPAPGQAWIEQCGQSFPSSVARWIELVSAYGWDPCSALRIIDCESDGFEAIYNGSGSGACGLWQHLPCQHNGDPVASTALAWAKYSGRGWQPWTVGGCFP